MAGAWVREERRTAGVHVTIGGPDRKAVQKAVLDYLRRWPPAGYDTRVSGVHRTENGFEAVGNRLSSCD